MFQQDFGSFKRFRLFQVSQKFIGLKIYLPCLYYCHGEICKKKQLKVFLVYEVLAKVVDCDPCEL